MERRPFGGSGLTASVIGLGCYGMSGVYGGADDAESIATIREAIDAGVNLLDTSASYGEGHNHRLIGQAIAGRRSQVIIHSKSGSPRAPDAEGLRGGGDPAYLRRTCEDSLRNLGIDALDVFCMSRVDPRVPIEESVQAMADLVRAGKTRFIGLSECSADTLRRACAVHPLVSLQMEYSLFSRDADEQGQMAACRDLDLAFIAYAVLGRGLISEAAPSPDALAPNDIRARLPRFEPDNFAANAQARERLARFARSKGLTLAQLAIAWTIARGRQEGAFVLPIPGAKTRAHLRENLKAGQTALTAQELAEIESLLPAGSVFGLRYPQAQMKRLNA